MRPSVAIARFDDAVITEVKERTETDRYSRFVVIRHTQVVAKVSSLTDT
jgi:hypothetical protein